MLTSCMNRDAGRSNLKCVDGVAIPFVLRGGPSPDLALTTSARKFASECGSILCFEHVIEVDINK